MLIEWHVGAGESGKSTILKQMRLIYTEGFGDHERKEIRQVIFANMIVAFKIIGEEMRDLGMDYELKQSTVCCAQAPHCPLANESKMFEAIIQDQEDIGIDDSFPIECLSAMKGLWADPSVQQTIKRGNEFALHDNIS